MFVTINTKDRILYTGYVKGWVRVARTKPFDGELFKERWTCIYDGIYFVKTNNARQGTHLWFDPKIWCVWKKLTQHQSVKNVDKLPIVVTLLRVGEFTKEETQEIQRREIIAKAAKKCYYRHKGEDAVAKERVESKKQQRQQPTELDSDEALKLLEAQVNGNDPSSAS